MRKPASLSHVALSAILLARSSSWFSMLRINILDQSNAFSTTSPSLQLTWTRLTSSLFFKKRKKGICLYFSTMRNVLEIWLVLCGWGLFALTRRRECFFELVVDRIKRSYQPQDISSLRLQSPMISIQSGLNNPPPSNFLLIPNKFAPELWEIKMTLRIWWQNVNV